MYMISGAKPLSELMMIKLQSIMRHENLQVVTMVGSIED